MKKSLLFLFLVCSTRAIAQSMALPPLLRAQIQSGQGWMSRDIRVWGNGWVMETHMIRPPDQESEPRQIATLTESQIDEIQKWIQSIKKAPLVQLDPNQHYNPGGFKTSYIVRLFDGNLATYMFAQNISGVDFGLQDGSGRELTAILNELLKKNLSAEVEFGVDLVKKLSCPRANSSWLYTDGPNGSQAHCIDGPS